MTDYESSQTLELSRWPGVTHTRETRGKHRALVLTFNGKSRFVTYPTSPSDSRRGCLEHLKDIRSTLRDLGAERTPVAKSAGYKPTRNKTEPKRIKLGEPILGGPNRDPWEQLKAQLTSQTTD